MLSADMLMDHIEQVYASNNHRNIVVTALYNTDDDTTRCVEMSDFSVKSTETKRSRQNFKEALKMLIAAELDNNPFDAHHKFVNFNNWRALLSDKEALYRFGAESIDEVKKIAFEADTIFDSVAKYIARSDYVPYIAVLRSEFYKQQTHSNEPLRKA